jgi:riboflavin synthase
MRLSIPEDIKAYMVPKGSIAIDGISLTIASMDAKSFRITIIPHTWNNTNLKKRRKGDKVNIEADLIAKYVHRLLSAPHFPLEKYKTKGLTKETLQFSGFEV